MDRTGRALRRRAFLGAAGVATLLAAACRKKPEPVGSAEIRGAPLPPPGRSVSAMPRRPLGRTGVTVSLVGLGGYHAAVPTDEQESIRLIRTAIDHGIDFLDNCWDYHDGRAEERMGKALEGGYRRKAFLMTKIDGRTRNAAADQIDQSLRRLRTDVIDLVQIHEVIRPTDPARCFGRDGCVEALVEAKRAGKLRFIGFTGHKDPSVHLAMLRAAKEHQFRFDAVQLPLNVLDAHYRSFEKLVLPALVADGVAVLGMKPLAAGKIVQHGVASAVECLHYAMNLPSSVVITGCENMADLKQAIHAALTFEALPPRRVAALLDRTREAAREGKLERFKTSEDHDGTVLHPEWLESASLGG